MVTLLVTLILLLVLVVLLVGALLFLKHRKRTRRPYDLPSFNKNRLSTSSVQSWHRRTRARPSQSIHVFQERQLLNACSDEPPTPTGLPEIRITFPEEEDAFGKRQSGRVVVVHVGERSSLGFEPLNEKLPSYQQSGDSGFQSVDLERVGGLTEKEIR